MADPSYVAGLQQIVDWARASDKKTGSVFANWQPNLANMQPENALKKLRLYMERTSPLKGTAKGAEGIALIDQVRAGLYGGPVAAMAGPGGILGNPLVLAGLAFGGYYLYQNRRKIFR